MHIIFNGSPQTKIVNLSDRDRVEADAAHYAVRRGVPPDFVWGKPCKGSVRMAGPGVRSRSATSGFSAMWAGQAVQSSPNIFRACAVMLKLDFVVVTRTRRAGSA